MAMPSSRQKGSPSISMRSENVPESPSSALQTTYFCAAGVASTVCHLMPAGKGGATATAQARVGHGTNDPGPRHGLCAAQALAPAMRNVVGQRTRIDDADASTDKARLARQPGDFLRHAKV